jgi:hypothetical protein
MEQCPEHAAAYQACKVLFEAKDAAAATLKGLQDCEQQLVKELAAANTKLEDARAAKAAAESCGNIARMAAATAAAAQAAAHMQTSMSRLERVQGQLRVAVAAVKQYEAASGAAFAEVRSAQHELIKRLAQQHRAMAGAV